MTEKKKPLMCVFCFEGFGKGEEVILDTFPTVAFGGDDIVYTPKKMPIGIYHKSCWYRKLSMDKADRDNPKERT